MSTSVRDQIRAFVISNFPVADPTALSDDTNLLDTGVMDSTGILEIINFIEPEFGIKVLDDEMEPDNLASISSLTAYISRKKA